VASALRAACGVNGFFDALRSSIPIQYFVC
jgi:hypothetical protein